MIRMRDKTMDSFRIAYPTARAAVHGEADVRLRKPGSSSQINHAAASVSNASLQRLMVRVTILRTEKIRLRPVTGLMALTFEVQFLGSDEKSNLREIDSNSGEQEPEHPGQYIRSGPETNFLEFRVKLSNVAFVIAGSSKVHRDHISEGVHEVGAQEEKHGGC